MTAAALVVLTTLANDADARRSSQPWSQRAW